MLFLKNNFGLFYFKIEKVPDNAWTSVWLTGIHYFHPYEKPIKGTSLEIDIYEFNPFWWTVPKMSIHDWWCNTEYRCPCPGSCGGCKPSKNGICSTNQS